MRTHVGIIIEDGKGRLLMQQRDDHVEFPTAWVLFGGRAEAGESPLEAIKREMLEEIGLKLDSPELFHIFLYKDIIQHIYHSKTDEVPSCLNEGKAYGYFSIDDAMKLELGFNMAEILWKFKHSRGKFK
jgi:8-oxo-dGTP pyrophosphatase MutT (NUDIX family)